MSYDAQGINSSGSGTSIKNTVCEALHYQVCKLAQEMGEPWRLRQAELMDALQAHTLMLGVVAGDSISQELLEELKDAEYNPDYKIIKVRCVRCHNVLKVTLDELKKALTFYHNDSVMEFKKQLRIRIPFVKWEFALTCWKRGDWIQPRTFIR